MGRRSEAQTGPADRACRLSRLTERWSILLTDDREEIQEKCRPDVRKVGYITQESRDFLSQVIAPDVREIAATFVAVYEARERADYDHAAEIQHTEALAAVQQVEHAFRSWLTVQTDPSAVAFLQELMWRCIMKR
jgi:hypothetical protein